MSVDPWVHEYLMAKALRFAEGKIGEDVVVSRYFQREVRGTLLRIEGGVNLVITGHVIPVEQIEDVLLVQDFELENDLRDRAELHGITPSL